MWIGTPYARRRRALRRRTYDPTSHYRAAAVFDFFGDQGLTPQRLRAISQHQLGLMIDRFDALGADPSLISRPDVALGELGGFLALVSPKAETLQNGLADRGIASDFRDDVLRLGPAPYLTDAQLHDAMDGLAETITAAESEARG